MIKVGTTRIIPEVQFNAVVTDGVTEASDLGLPVGEWPDVLLVGTVRWTRANRLPSVHGNFSGFSYTLPGTAFRLSVYND
jgi:hypothetical protein